MTRDEIKSKYYDWICKRVSSRKKEQRYSFLLSLLNSIDFRYAFAMDGNRETDGFDLRYRFGYDAEIPTFVISSYLDTDPCTMLEMLAALAINCEDHIMYDYEMGDRTDIWFWDMISNLGLSRFDNEHFDEYRVREIIDIFQNHEYCKDGTGGLFITNDPLYDMRRKDIWTQANHYFIEYY